MSIEERLKNVERVTVQMATVIDKISAFCKAMTSEVLSLVNSVSLIQKEIQKHKAPSGYFI